MSKLKLFFSKIIIIIVQIGTKRSFFIFYIILFCVCLGVSVSWCVFVCPHGDDVDKVVLPQRVQDGVDGVFGDGHLQALHAAADVHHDDDVFGRRGRLDVPAAGREGGGASYQSQQPIGA